jgi:hypothetical protein
MLDGDSNTSTTIGAYNAIWGSYDSAPTTGSTSAALNGAMVYAAYAGHRWQINGSEKLRLDSTGRLVIGNAGTSTIAYTFGGQELQTGVGCPANGVMSFYAGSSTERMRLDSGGSLGIGLTPSGVVRLHVQSSGTTSGSYIAVFENSSTADAMYIRSDGYISTGLLASSPYNATTAAAANIFVYSDGGLYRSTSSLKYKTAVNDATHGLAELLTLRAVTYKGKSETDGDKVYGGLIAEEVHEAGLTEFVQYAEDGTPDALAYGNMVSLCIKAIQELEARVKQLEAK